MKANKTKSFFKWISLIVLLAFSYLVYMLFTPNFSSETNESSYLCIPTGSSFENVLQNLDTLTKVSNATTFKQVAKLLKYDKNVKPGRYELKQGMNNFQLIRLLRSGRQTPVKLKFNNIRTKEQLAGRLSKQVMADSIDIINLLHDSAYLAAFNLNPATSISIFIPNTYEVFWNIEAKKLFERMHKEHLEFWTENRKAKAADIPLTETEVSILASIVEEETNNVIDKPRVAGLYLNRLKIGMPLQADPTVKFAVGDFSLKRILFGHLRNTSPYNTYRFTGLPPGPIRVASPASIDAVLNYAHHDYIYMCASSELNGEHKFAVTWLEHQKNAKEYRKTLDKMKIFE